jgi:hypothetical protein
MEKIFITGTGRCGTTFLIKLFSFLNFDTGFNKDNYKHGISSNCNSGMERSYKENYYIIKNPTIIMEIPHILNDKTVKIKIVIIPIRDYGLAAMSRVKHQHKNGGLWNATDKESQVSFFNKIISNYLYWMTKHEINTIFLDFDKMTTDKDYLFHKIKHILHEKSIDFSLFSKVYDEVTATL